MRISDWSSDVCSSDLHRIDLAGDQRRRQREVHVDQLDVGEAEPDRPEHGVQRRLLGAGDREADLAALQIRERVDRGVRSEEARVGKEGVSTCRSRWAQKPEKKTNESKK